MATLDNNLKINPKSWTPDELALINENKMDDELFAIRLYEQTEASPAILSKEQMYKIESNIQNDVNRRAAFAIATRTGKELCSGIAEDRDTALAILEVTLNIKELKENYQMLLDMFSSLETRFMVALCVRDDFEELLAEANLNR